MPENHLKSEDIDAPLSFAYSLAVSQHVWVDVEPCSFSTLPTNISKRLPSFSMQGKSSPLQLARLEPLGHRVTGNRQQGPPRYQRRDGWCTPRATTPAAWPPSRCSQASKGSAAVPTQVLSEPMALIRSAARPRRPRSTARRNGLSGHA